MDRALILLGLGLYFRSTSVSLIFVVNLVNLFLVTSVSLPFSELSVVTLALDLVD